MVLAAAKQSVSVKYMTLNAEQSFIQTAQNEIAKSRDGEPHNSNTNQQEVDPKSATESADKLAQLLRNNNLKNWDSSTADVQLAPVSCIDIYRQLVILNKPLQLLPHNEATADIGNNHKNIITTKHPAGKLALRCRKMEMETSKNNKIQYSLFIAAGFAVTNTQDGTKQRVPILLIPVTISRTRGRGSSYSIRYTGESLRLNPNVAESSETHLDQLIKPFEKAADMRDYLRAMSRKLHANLQCRISANTGLFSLQADVLDDITEVDQFSVELERTKPGIEFKPLPPTPDKFNAQLAIRILRFIDQDQLNHALRVFTGDIETTQSVSVLDYDLELQGETRAKAMKCAQWLCEVGLGHWRLDSLSALPERIMRMSTSVQTLCDDNTFNRHIDKEFQNIGMLLNLYRAQSRITTAPPQMQHHAISLHADPDTRLLLQKAKIQATSIEHEMETQCETFHMSAVPSSTALHNLIKIIARREESSQLTNPHYFRARRQLNEILKTHNGLITDNDLVYLEALAKSLRFAELFEEDAYYKRCFGSLFHGIRTNWQRLDSVVDFARNLSYDLGSSELVGRLCQHWPSFQRDFANLQGILRPAATDAHKLCSLIPLFINSGTSLDHALTTTNKFHDKVDSWQKYLKKYIADGALTPYAILRKEDKTEIESAQQISFSETEYDDRIYHHIVGVGLSNENVAATAEWLLNSIDRLQIDIPTVRRYLDSECQLERKLSVNGL